MRLIPLYSFMYCLTLTAPMTLRAADPSLVVDPPASPHPTEAFNG